ncbi:MAG: ferritin-like domain-containing protein [Ilumatobacteraceae bacterium]
MSDESPINTPGGLSGTDDAQRSQLADDLNGDLQLEFQSIVQYVQHVATITGAEYASTIDELKVHLGQELVHATVLAEQVAFLGGTPITTVASVPETSDSRGALQADLDLETNQLERYRNRVTQATEFGLPDVAEALRPLLTQTQEHVRDLQTALGQ